MVFTGVVREGGMRRELGERVVDEATAVIGIDSSPDENACATAASIDVAVSSGSRQAPPCT
jgi:hypothetical protein